MLASPSSQPDADTADNPQRPRDAWWVRLGPELQGPMSADSVRQRWSAGVYSRWHEGSRDGKTWQPIRDVLDSLPDPQSWVSLAALGPEPPADLGDSPDAFDWNALVAGAPKSTPGEAAHQTSRPLPARPALIAGGVLFLALTALPVVAAQGQAAPWWRWPAEASGKPFAGMLAGWLLLGLGFVATGLWPNASVKSTQRAGLGLAVTAWGVGWLGAFGGPALAMVTPAWLFLAPAMTATAWRGPASGKWRSGVPVGAGVSVALAAVVACVINDALTAKSAATFSGAGVALITLGMVTRFGHGHASNLPTVGIAGMSVLLGLIGTFLASSEAAAWLKNIEPHQAGAQHVRAAIVASGALALAGLSVWLTAQDPAAKSNTEPEPHHGTGGAEPAPSEPSASIPSPEATL